MPLNYRHQFHAGNFADVMKHAILLALIEAMRARGAVRIVDTHAGSGLYDLRGEAAMRSAEAQGGSARLMAAFDLPGPLARLRQAVQAENPTGALHFYPGSPLLAVSQLRSGEAYTGYELRPDDFASLQELMTTRNRSAPTLSQPRGAKAGAVSIKVHQADGYAALNSAMKGGELVLIDPPFERSDDYARAGEAVDLALDKKGAVAIWVPIKDLETLDAFERRLEKSSPFSLTVAEVRLRPLVNPMALNGCAMVLVNAPDVTAEASLICNWVAEVCGETGGRGRVTRHGYA